MSFLDDPPVTPAVQSMYDADTTDDGYVMNLTRVWAQRPAADDAFRTLAGLLGEPLTLRERAVLVSATAATLGDAYCALAWGTRLAAATSPEIAAGVLLGDDEGLSASEAALASWARAVTRDPSATTAAEVGRLHEAGYDDAAIFSITGYVALRIAFSTVNGALGAAPDAELAEAAPAQVRAAVTWGRPAATS